MLIPYHSYRAWRYTCNRFYGGIALGYFLRKVSVRNELEYLLHGNRKDGFAQNLKVYARFKVPAAIKLESGQRFGSWTVICRSIQQIKGRVYWDVQCDCGAIRSITSSSLVSGATKSCGCKRRKVFPGNVFGRLEAIVQVEPNSRKQARWRCKCECGNSITVIAASLTTGKTKSCGCLRRDINHFTEYDDAISATTILYLRYKKDAGLRNKPFQLDKDFFRSLISKNCHYCGDEPSRMVRRANNSRTKVYQFKHHGIDRIDNELGYTPENCATCCAKCNRAKDTMTVDEFIAWAVRIAQKGKEIFEP